MNTTTDSRVGQYLTLSTGVVHASARCGIRKGQRPYLITAEDVAYWQAEGTEHTFCTHCH